MPRDRSNLVSREGEREKEERCSSFAEIKRARFIPQPSGRLLFDSRCDNRDSRHTVRFIPDDLPRRPVDASESFSTDRGGWEKTRRLGERERERGNRALDGDRGQEIDRGRRRARDRDERERVRGDEWRRVGDVPSWGMKIRNPLGARN